MKLYQIKELVQVLSINLSLKSLEKLEGGMIEINLQKLLDITSED